ncbi:MAG TPA: selenocysteine-specific translation elongation factor [Frankiaceae bacterium]|jgi:selenocysteine-specific elongation factor|nr:selenocysteine-specific translation elongation factor [Frankiaceae bacterium]
MFVIATAGHVDHGKSTLVRALTGMEPDRLEEERRRGLTIELGYAWTILQPSGEQLAFVDVPGHHRFLRTMLAGVGPVPAAMLVVAADGGWEAQTAEHVAALDALGVEHGLVAVTRSDLADPEPVRQDVLERLRGTSLGAQSPEIIAVSGRTGAGLPELREALQRLTSRLPKPVTTGRVRLWVDRAFTIGGAGTVVTATLGSGTIRVGDELDLAGAGVAGGTRRVHVRGLQALGGPEREVSAVARVALNLRGTSLSEAARGDALLTPDADLLTRRADVGGPSDSDLSDLPAELVLHLGAASVPVHVRPLGERFARLTLEWPLPLRRGDRALLRDPGRQSVVAAVTVADIDPPPLDRRGAAVARAAELAAGLDAVAEVARRRTATRRLLDQLGVLPADVSLPEGLREVGGLVVTDATWLDLTRRLAAAVQEAGRADPLAGGLPAAAAAEQLHLTDARLIEPLAAAAGLRLHKGRVAPAAAPTLPPAAQSAYDVIAARLGAHPFDAPDANDLAAAGLTAAILAAAVRQGLLLRLGTPSSPVVLLPDAPDRAVELLAALPAPFTVSDARGALNTTRRIAVPLLEHLDASRRTRRVDAAGRVVLPPT